MFVRLISLSQAILRALGVTGKGEEVLSSLCLPRML